ncbi:MAG: hypothetical protein RBU37_15795 [Myxococcota bacterium]|nr:hypothetical protein [Myxococcota bacterium]
MEMRNKLRGTGQVPNGQEVGGTGQVPNQQEARQTRRAPLFWGLPRELGSAIVAFCLFLRARELRGCQEER